MNIRGAVWRTGRRDHGPAQSGCQILGGYVGVSVAGGAQERRAPVVFGQGLHQRDLARREAVREVEDDQAQIVQSGSGAGSHRFRRRFGQVFGVVPFSAGEPAESLMQACDLAGDPAAGRQCRAHRLVGVAQLTERGANAGLSAGMLPNALQWAIGSGQRLPYHQVLDHGGERVAALLLEGSRAQQLRQDGQQNEPDVGEPRASQFLSQGQARVRRGCYHGYGSEYIVLLLIFDEPPQRLRQIRRQPINDKAMLVGNPR